MAGITLEQAESKLTAALAALDAVMLNQEYRIGNQTVTRANLKEVQDLVDYWDAKVKRLSGGGPRIFGGTPT